jgi:hypothetical protein
MADSRAGAPAVSVVLSTWNWSAALRCSIPSVLAQTHGDFELLVVGDGCTDDSGDVVASFDDPRVRWHNLPDRTGSQVEPNNAGAALARAPLLAYLGHDDLWHPRHLASVLAVQERTQADLVLAVTMLYGPPRSGIRAITGLPAAVADAPPRFSPTPSWLVRRAMVLGAGGWRDHRLLRLPHDRELLLRLWRLGARITDSGEFTVLKLPSAWRRDAYRERRTDEQQELLRRMAAEPDFRDRELIGALAAAAEGKLIDVSTMTEGEPGELVETTLAFKGAAAPLPPGERLEELAYDFDRILPGFEWHGPEHDPVHGSFQWSGPSTASSLHLPLAATRNLQLTVEVLHALHPSILQSLRLEVNGESVDLVRESQADGSSRFHALLPAAALAQSSGPVRLLFHVERTLRPCDVDPANSDRRSLGLAFCRLTVRPADGTQT